MKMYTQIKVITYSQWLLYKISWFSIRNYKIIVHLKYIFIVTLNKINTKTKQHVFIFVVRKEIKLYKILIDNYYYLLCMWSWAIGILEMCRSASCYLVRTHMTQSTVIQPSLMECILYDQFETFKTVYFFTFSVAIY